MIKMYLEIQDIFTRPNEFLPDMSGGQTEFREDCYSFQGILMELSGYCSMTWR